MNKKTQNRFTLIELLVVMGLMVLMVSLALPAFSRMAGNNKLDIMASNISTALAQGQSTAVGRNCYVAVVFPNKNCDKAIIEYAFGGYRLAELKSEDGENFTFVRWINDSYMNSPNGAYLVEVRTTVLKDTTDKDNNKKDAQAADEFKGDGLKSVAGLPDNITGNTSVIFKSTGESVNSEIYFVIASGKVTADTNSNSLATIEPADFRQIKLNPFTGRAEYVTDDDAESTSSQGGDK